MQSLGAAHIAGELPDVARATKHDLVNDLEQAAVGKFTIRRAANSKK
jgi:hypothetical protein